MLFLTKKMFVPYANSKTYIISLKRTYLFIKDQKNTGWVQLNGERMVGNSSRSSG